MHHHKETTLGPFRVDPSGRLYPNEPGSNPSFDFAWRNRPVHAVLCGESLTLQAMLGRVPSTGAGQPGNDPTSGERERVFAMLSGLQKFLPSLWRLRLLADHRVQVDAEGPLDWPTTAAGLMTSVTQFLIELAPYLDLLEESGVANRPGSAVGSGGRLKI